MSTQQEFLDDLVWRGLIEQSTDLDALARQLAAGPMTLYCGFDPTAVSLHVGSLVPLLTLRRFQLAGHRVIALVGGATGLIGDPSGRSAERQLNTTDVVAGWVDSLRDQVSAYLDLDGDNAARIVSNLDWTADVSVIDFLRDVGRHFSVNVMLAKDSVKNRLADQGISYTEFSYMLLQSFDYLHLLREYECRLQIGGADQWGNITAGLDLIRRVEGPEVAATVHGLTLPLVTKSDGTKFGKTADGAIWIDPSLTSAYEFYQFWINTDDRDVIKLLKYYSFRSRPELEALFAEQEAAPHTRPAQRALAEELTRCVHGDRGAEQAELAGRALFGRAEISDLDEDTVAAVMRTAPHGAWTAEQEPTIVDLLVTASVCKSRSEARRAVAEGGAYLNNERITDGEELIGRDRLIHGRWWLVRRGKRTFGAVTAPNA